MLEVKMDRVPFGISDKKVLNPTMKMLEFALHNAGFSEGVWILKSPHRTRKKSAERFMALRLEGSGFRVRCKPGGNDTCFEWTLLPPEHMDQNSVFSDLRSLHSKTMRSTRKFKDEMVDKVEASIVGVLFDRLVDAKPEIAKTEVSRTSQQETTQQEIKAQIKQSSTSLKKLLEIQKNLILSDLVERERRKDPKSLTLEMIANNRGCSVSAVGNLAKIMESESGVHRDDARRLYDDSVKAEAVEMHKRGVKISEIAKHLLMSKAAVTRAIKSSKSAVSEPPQNETVEEQIKSLDLSSMEQPRSDYAMDRALIAFEMLAGDSLFMKKNALFEGFNKLLKIDELVKKNPRHGSVKGAIRSILMACCSSEYMERIVYGSNTNGYRITEKGKERLLTIRSLIDLAPSPNDIPKPAQKTGSDKIGLLKGLIAEHDSATKGVDELGQLISELENEIEDEELKLSGLSKSLEEKTLQRDELSKEISRLQEKFESLQKDKQKRLSDMDELKRERDEMSRKKTEIESKLASR